MITPDNQDQAADAASSNEQCVPLAALAVDGTKPAAGDDVDYRVTGKISRIEGEHAYVTPEKINDEPATEPASAEPDDPMEAAMKADESGAGM